MVRVMNLKRADVRMQKLVITIQQLQMMTALALL